MSDEQALHERRTARLAQVLAREEPEPGEAHACPYLPGREARQVSLLLPGERPGLYHSLMDLNFRRLGPVAYHPACEGCQACRALRVPTAAFRPDRSQRRCLARNADLSVEVRPPARYRSSRVRSGLLCRKPTNSSPEPFICPSWRPSR